MNTEDRRKSIIDYLQYHPNCSVNQIIALFDVAPATVRRDLTHLEQDGQIQRTYGQIHLKQSRPPSDFHTRAQKFSAEKREIACAAVRFIQPRDCVAIDSGTTAYAVAEQIFRMNNNVTIVTNSLSVATAQLSTHKVILSGGVVDPDNLALIGPDVESFFERISASVAFIGTTGIRSDAGPTVISPFFAGIKRKIMACAQKKILIFDNSKIMPVGTFVFADYSEFDAIIVSRPLTDEALLRKLDESGVPVIVASA